ncbi:hypothetical protein TIFTF001_011260 [Ficus carica]|uniref:Uncharacterized protein n=1 Tax=Ficus carica TaxID=3494 RepID=A0AA88A001_FICCA|nr:hypothetical protein TIFTF001_011260 [Ficus carica]
MAKTIERFESYNYGQEGKQPEKDSQASSWGGFGAAGTKGAWTA